MMQLDFRQLVRRATPDWRKMVRGVKLRRPRGWLHWLSVILIAAIAVAYSRMWLSGNWEMLTNPALQNDDARTAVFPFHRYGPEGALANDPIANEMMGMVPIGVFILYRVLVPLTTVYVASKIIQALCIAIVLYAGWVLMTARRAGLGAGVLLVFLLLHDPFVLNRIAGGLARGFGFPCIALWIAGALANRRGVRWAATLIAAATYPSALLMILAGEGILVVKRLARRHWRRLLRPLGHYAILVGLCFVVMLPQLVGGNPGQGSLHTLAQAKKEPAFGKRGRLWQLPFDDPNIEFGKSFAAGFRPAGERPFPKAFEHYADYESAVPIAVLASLVLLPFLRLSPTPWAALSLFVGIAIMYVLSRLAAFRMYSPERYYSYGMRITAIALTTNVLAFVAFWKRRPPRAAIRNVAVAAFIAISWLVLGNGIAKNNGMTIDARPHAKLFALIHTLPLDARIATHPMDGDDIPYFGARANVGSFETLQPWLTGSWRKQRERAEATLRALYTTDRAELLRYADEYHVTHLLLNDARYRNDFVARSASFEPLTNYANQLLRGRQLDAVVLAHVPPEAVVFRGYGLTLVDVSRLRDAWSH
jgi:hypothetical protein